ncbi:hypothetical protein [Xanthomonas citri]|uniref:hypothetical protein n=1 Tax=Xanthomonas citri TaxID=346 RepID=UPI004047BEDD
MGLLLILPLLVSGYLVCIKDKAVFFKLHRYDGQLLYFLVAYHGLKCFVASLLLVGVVSLIVSHEWAGGYVPATQLKIPSFSTDFLALGGRLIADLNLMDEVKVGDNSASAHVPLKDAKAQFYFFWVLVSFFTVLAPFALAKSSAAYMAWKYRLYESLGSSDNDSGNGNTKEGAKPSVGGYRARDSLTFIDALLTRESVQHLPIASALVEAWMNKKSVMISMSDRKVYVGIIHSVGSVSEVSGSLEHFGIWPVKSGYRDKDSLLVNYTHDYPAWEDGKVEIEFPPLFLKQESIVSVTFYDEVYGGLIKQRVEDSNLAASKELPVKAEARRGFFDRLISAFSRAGE